MQYSHEKGCHCQTFEKNPSHQEKCSKIADYSQEYILIFVLEIWIETKWSKKKSINY